MISAQELMSCVKSYDPTVDESLLLRAYNYSKHVHVDQKRASGEPYFHHPLEVALIIASFKLDVASIVTALLHDTIEDTIATYEDILTHFGKEIADLVRGVTKLSSIELQSIHTSQAENFHKLILATSKDVRVLLIKLADRLHNMRTLFHIHAPEKRQRIAKETMEIYAPLAERMGIQQLRDELYELSFEELNHDAAASISRRKQLLLMRDPDLIPHIVDELKQLLASSDIYAIVYGREKTTYSIWQKMQIKNIPFEQLSDIFAFRIIVDDVAKCYQTLGILHSTYTVIPGRFKDYISTPKPNNYQSLHTCVFGPGKQNIEIQIRTHEMHEICELGIAAHWQYKQGTPKKGEHEYRWLRGLLDILENASSPEEFLEHTKMEMFQDQVFLFTPHGDLFSLPEGSSPVDFAYAIHSEVGNRCVGAKINGKLMPLRTRLQNGDQVEILTSKTQIPSPAWERFIVTGKAKSCLRRFLRQHQRDEAIANGKTALQKFALQEKLNLNEKILLNVLDLFNAKTIEDLYLSIGQGHTKARDVIHVLKPQKETPDKLKVMASDRHVKKQKDSINPIHGITDGVPIHYAKCCHPLPGEDIVGVILSGRGVKVHTAQCKNIINLGQDTDKLIDISWGAPDTDQKYVGRLKIVAQNTPGVLATISNLITKNNVNIAGLKMMNRTRDFFDMIVDLEVDHKDRLLHLVSDLRACSTINSVDRL